MTIIHKTVAERDGMDFVLSDETLDRYGDIIEAKGWDLRDFKKNPIALFGHRGDFPIGNWTNVRVEGTKLIGTLVLAASGTSERINELISLVQQGILRAVSVGFRPIENEPIDPKHPYGGQRYTKQQLLETSLVSVPANPSALALAKSLHVSDETLEMAFGEHAVMRRDLSSTGENADTTSANATVTRAAPPSQQKAPKMTTLSERIQDAQKDLNDKRDKLAELAGADTLDNDAIGELTTQIDGLEKTIETLKAAEAKIGTEAQQKQTVTVPAQVRKPLGVAGKELSGFDLVVRAGVVHTLAKMTGKPVEKVLEERYPGHDATAAVVQKADATVATTTTSGWASELINTGTGEFINTLKPDSVLPDLLAMGTSLVFNNGQGAIKLPSRTTATSVNGDFVLQGDPIPVRRLTTTSVTLTPHKVGVISTFTKELAKYSTPAIEGLIRSEMTADTAVTIDGKLLDATAGSTTRPAGLLNGVAALSAYGGSDYAAFLADMKTLMAPFDTANAGRRMALIMHPAQARGLFLMPGPDGTFGWADRFTREFKVLTSTAATAGRVIAVDAADFAGAYGGMEFDVSEQATLHMSDAPAELVTASGTVADPTRSLWQTASIGVRMLLDVTWAMRRSGMVQWIDGVGW